MITPKDIKDKTMTEEKKKSAKNDYFAFYIGRPISYILTIPFLYTRISPNAVSMFSIIPIIIGFLLMGLGNSLSLYIIGWICFFLWNLLDGVDGNIARYKKQFSRMGSVYDAMSGYIAMILSFFAWGWAASHHPGLLAQYIPVPDETYIVLGALSGIFQIFPRFIMHKAMTTVPDLNTVSGVKDKSEYGIIKLTALNLISISGMCQVLMLVAVLFNLLAIFTIAYFVLNLSVMLLSLGSIFKRER